MNEPVETQVIVCVTNSMRDFRPCTYRDQHTLNCDRGEYAWNEARGREETTGHREGSVLPPGSGIEARAHAAFDA